MIGTEVDEKGKSLQLCVCDCGTNMKIHTYRLKNGSTVSCGCHSRDIAKERMTKIGAELARRHQMDKPLAVKAGDKFGMLTIQKELAPQKESSGRNRRTVLCICDCGNEKIISVRRLLSGNTRSCGCLRSMGTQTKHGAWRHRAAAAEYRSWHGAKDRCYNTMARNYADYGGRGITMSDEWKDDFERFLSDMGEKPSRDHSLDRIDVNEGYSRENCRWATGTEQVMNRRTLTLEDKIEREKLKIQTSVENLKRMAKKAELLAEKVELDLNQITNEH